MGSSDNFCLRWNDFESNISTSFRELRDDSEFFDVTLCCDNGTDLVQAHKVILAACSPLFRKILAHQKNQQNPLLYLKGIRLKELQAVLNFMYHGEVNVAQDSLNNFLAVAEELAVKGLTTDSQGSSNAPEARKKAVAKRKSLPQSGADRSNSGGGSATKKAKNEDDDDDHGHHGGGDGIDIKRIKAEPEPSGSGAHQSSAMEDIGDDSYAGEEGADDFGDGEDFEGFAQYGEGQDFDDSLAGASGSGAGADGKDGEYDGDFLKYFKKGFRSSFASPISTVEGFEDYSERRTSEVWKHFLLNKAMEKAKCKHCSELLSVVTTTLKNHLKMKHQIFVKSLRDDRPVRFSSDSYRGTGGHAGQDSYGGAGGGHHAGQASGDITGHSELPQ